MPTALAQSRVPGSGRGGRRPGAGRPPNGKRPGVSHLRRPALSSRHPVHVTWRVGRTVPNLRGRRAFAALRRGFAAGRERLGGRVVHFSVQGNHIHLIVEASGREALSRALQGLAVRLARGLNRAVGREGRVFADRFHARALRTPLEVKRALAYVLNNLRKHVAQHGGRLPPGFMDACSSAAWFDGWRLRDAVERSLGLRAVNPRDPPPVARARTWLLRAGWRRHGLLDPDRRPG